MNLYDHWISDLNWSAQIFSDLVWPILQGEIGGELIHVEKITEVSFAKNFDQLSGIDAWHIRDDKGIRGIASRVQICPSSYEPYRTFTIRKSRDFSKNPTEYEKRKIAIRSQHGWLYPHLTVQAYIDSQENSKLRCFAVAKTEDIIQKIDDGDCYVKRTSNAEFYVICWNSDLCIFYYES